MATIDLNVNGKTVSVQADPGTPLLWVLRDTLRLTGTKYGCGEGVCGACTVLLDGKAARSCQVPVGTVGRARVTTLEGLAAVRPGLQRAWIEEDVPQCGFCQPGMLLAASALLDAKPDPTDREIEEAFAGMVCRCGTYARIRKAVRRAAGGRP
jgi:isoquinoline 1-oxidoreductase alpha subunit